MNMSPIDRINSVMDFKEPDYIPLFFTLTYHGARELNMSIYDYFRKPENVAKGQLIMNNKYKFDCLSPFYYSALETEAFGGEVIFRDECPPNAGAPFIKSREDIMKLEIPNVQDTRCLQKCLTTISILKSETKGRILVVGSVTSPFSLPIMQMGFDKYIELLYEDEEGFNVLMKKNVEFCVEWAKAQLKAGADAISFADPMASTDILSKELYIKKGYNIDKKVINELGCSVAFGLASTRCLPVIDLLKNIGADVITASYNDNLSLVRKIAGKDIVISGNINGLDMSNWNAEDVNINVKDTIRRAGKKPGFILSDSTGEIPWQINDDILYELVESARKWGKYPLDWIDENE